MKIHVLIVEDNPTNLKLTSEMLEEKGHFVTRAADAEMAQEMLQVVTPDIILTDINLPRMDGLALTRKLKADARLKGVPVIAFTAHAMAEDEQRALDAGCDGYIPKPIDPRRFIEQVTVFFRKSLDE